MSLIEMKNLTKTFGQVTAIDDINLKIDRDKIYGLLGRNGAGKTTLLNLISNRLFPDTGEITIEGDSVIENDLALSKVYFMTEKGYYPENMTVKSGIKWGREFYSGFDEAYALYLCDKFQLKINKKIKNLSTGYQSIFKAIVALSCNAKVVLLDEPVLGLDANHRDLFYKELIKSYDKKPKTIIISTHLIEEAADIIEDVIVIKNGKVIVNDPVEKVLSQGYSVSGNATLVDKFLAGKSVLGSDSIGGLKSAYVLGNLDRMDIPEGLEIARLDLQRLFIHMTNS